MPDGTVDLSTIIGPVLQRSRHSAGMTLADAQSRSGFSKSYIGEIERGMKNPTLLAVDTLLTTYGVSQSRFLEELSEFWKLRGVSGSPRVLTLEEKVDRIRMILDN